MNLHANKKEKSGDTTSGYSKEIFMHWQSEVIFIKSIEEPKLGSIQSCSCHSLNNRFCSGGDVRSASFNPPQGERAEVSGVEFNGPEGSGSSWSLHPRKSPRGGGGSQDWTTGRIHSRSSNPDGFYPFIFSNWKIIQSQGETSKREQDAGLLWQTRFKYGCPTWEITHLQKQNPSRPGRIFWFHKVFCWAVLSLQHRFMPRISVIVKWQRVEQLL